MLLLVGVLEDLVDLGKTAGPRELAYLLREALPDLIEEFGAYFIETNWQDLVDLGKAAGISMWHVFEIRYGLPALKAEFGEGFVNHVNPRTYYQDNEERRSRSNN